MPYGGVTKVASLLNVSRPTVRKALKGSYDEHNTDELNLALRIRKCALNNGGVEKN